MSTPEIELPVFQHREATSTQCLDVGSRLVALLLHGSTGLPAEDWLTRAVVEAADDHIAELSVRMRLERGSQFSRDKSRAHLERRRYLVGIRSAARQLMTHPDPTTPLGKRAAAAKVVNLFTKHRAALRSRSQGETTAAVRLLLEECANDEMGSALKETELQRLHTLLQEAQNRYVEIVRQEDSAEAEVEVPGDSAATTEVSAGTAAGTKSTVRKQREIRDSLASRLSLAFDNMAFLAGAGREPYSILLAQCREVTDELNSLIKLRDTLGRKAEAKRIQLEKDKAEAEGRAQSPSNVQAKAPTPDSTAPRDQSLEPASGAAAVRDGLSG
jgi:hypothetical protein